MSSIEEFCGEPKVREAKMVGFENRIAEYKDVFEKRKRRKLPFADQKTIIDDTPQSFAFNSS